MADRAEVIHDAIDRWRRDGLVDGDLAERLRAEVVVAERAHTREASRYVLAVTGAIVLLLAAGAFMSWAWPRMEEPARAGFLAAAGVALRLLGARFEGRVRWTPAAYLLQSAGLALFLIALLYSENAWPDRSVAAVLLATGGMVFALVAAVRSLRSAAVMPAVHLAFGLAYLAVFLDRSLEMDTNQVILVLDAVVVGLLVALMALVRRDPTGEEVPWALESFLVALYAGLVMVWTTTVEIFGVGDGATLPIAAWFWLIVAVTVWGIERAPPGMRRGWYPRHLAWLCLLWIPLGFWTAADVTGGSDLARVLFVSGPGIAAFLYADRRSWQRVMQAAALCFIAGLWYWAVEAAGALGAVGALVATAALLFWLSGRAPVEAQE